MYLVRHGEAIHNVAEDKAKKLAMKQAEAEGFSKDSTEFKEMVEEARKSVLNDASLFDPELSERGQEQVLRTKAELERLTSEPSSWPKPTCILVSPLHRTLETASLLFPDHPSVYVRTVLRERKTGLSCDEPRPATESILKRSFSGFSFDELSEDEDICDTSTSSTTPTMASSTKSNSFSLLDDVELEDKFQLRCRTAHLAELLRAYDDEVFCVVTHKGYLRELERGPFARPTATEFSTGEIRVYDVELGDDDTMIATLRSIRQ